MDKMKKDILSLLEQDARFSPKKLAQMTSYPEDEIVKVISQMENDGVIVGYTTVVNTDLIDGDSVQAQIEVKVTPVKSKGFDAIAEEIVKFPEVDSVTLMSGGYDLSVIIKGRNLKEIAQFVSERLSTLDNVISTTTHFILKKYKLDGMIFEKKFDNREMVNP